MKNSLLLFFCLCFLACRTTINQSRNDYYKKNEYSRIKKPYSSPLLDINIETELEQFTTNFYTLLTEINTNKRSIEELKQYFPKIGNNLIGISIIDGMIKHIFPDKNAELLKILEEYLRQNKNLPEHIIKELSYVHKIRSNLDKYINSTFSFSTVLYRKNIFKDFSIILPNNEWNIIKIEDTNDLAIVAGDGSNSGAVLMKTEKIPLNYSLLEDNSENNTGRVYFSKPDMNQPKNAYLEEYQEIVNNCHIGNKYFKKIYDRKQYSDGQNNWQEIVSTERVYISETEKISIFITNFIAGDHLLADIERMILIQKKLLDSVLFN